MKTRLFAMTMGIVILTTSCSYNGAEHDKLVREQVELIKEQSQLEQEQIKL